MLRVACSEVLVRPKNTLSEDAEEEKYFSNSEELEFLGVFDTIKRPLKMDRVTVDSDNSNSSLLEKIRLKSIPHYIIMLKKVIMPEVLKHISSNHCIT